MMKVLFSIASVALLVTACGSPQTASTQPTITQTATRPLTSTDEAKVRCVASDGFLVPSGGSFACRLASGQVVSLASL